MYVKTPVERLLAERVANSFIALNDDLNQLRVHSQGQISDSEFGNLRRTVGDVLGIMYLDLMKNIWEQYPDLRPEGMP